MKKLFLFALLLCFVACENKNPDTPETQGEYVDLGLSSGTKWKKVNEKNSNDENGFYTYEEAMEQFEQNLPTQEQWLELRNECEWESSGMGYKVSGTNGNSIILPCAGYRDCAGGVNNVGSYGYYWSSTPYGSEQAWRLCFSPGWVMNMNHEDCCCGLSVRLVR